MSGNNELSPERLITLVHHRWNVPVLAELYRDKGAKFVTLANRLGASRGPLSASLSYLAEHDLIVRNPGYGHPMRPEYLLSRQGDALGEDCLRLVTLLDRSGETEFAFHKWTLPLVAAIGRGRAKRFNELRRRLGEGATPRATTLGLKALLAQAWIARSLIDEYPPAAGYSLTARGRKVLALIEPLC